MALEGGMTKEEQESFTSALAHKVKENYKRARNVSSSKTQKKKTRKC